MLLFFGFLQFVVATVFSPPVSTICPMFFPMLTFVVTIFAYVFSHFAHFDIFCHQNFHRFLAAAEAHCQALRPDAFSLTSLISQKCWQRGSLGDKHMNLLVV